MAQRETLGRDVPEELAEKLFHAAFSLFGEKGFERTTMDEVAARSGVARATLYYYFRGKDDLFLFLLERGVSMLGVMLSEAMQSGATARERLEHALDRLIDLMAEFRDVLLVAMQQFGRIASTTGEAHAWIHDRSTGTLRRSSRTAYATDRCVRSTPKGRPSRCSAPRAGCACTTSS